MRFLAVFESHFGHFVCKMGQNGPFRGSRGVQNEFFGPETHSGPNEYRFLTKKYLGKIFFSGPPGPPTEKNFGPGPGRHGRARGQPKGGQNRSVGVCNPSKPVKHPMVHGKGGVDRPVTPPLAKVMTQTRFLAFLGVFGPFSGPAGPETL